MLSLNKTWSPALECRKCRRHKKKKRQKRKRYREKERETEERQKGDHRKCRKKSKFPERIVKRSRWGGGEIKQDALSTRRRIQSIYWSRKPRFETSILIFTVSSLILSWDLSFSLIFFLPPSLLFSFFTSVSGIFF